MAELAPPAVTSRRGGWSVALVCTGAMVVTPYMQFSLGVLGPFITVDLGLSRAAFGSLPTVLFAAGAALSLAAGPLVDRLGGRRTLLATFLLSGLSAAAAAAAPTFAALTAAVAFSGVGMALSNPATNQLLAQHVDPVRQGVVTGVKQSGVQFAAFLVGVTLPTLATLVGWRSALASVGGVAVVGLAVAALVVPRDRRVSEEPGRGPTPALPAVGWLTSFAVCMGAGIGAFGAYLPLYVVEAVGWSPAVAGLASGLSGLVGVVARIGWGRWLDRSDVAVSGMLGMFAVGSVVASGLLLAAAPVAGWLLWPGVVLLGVTAIAWNAVGMLAIVRGVDVRVAGRASGRVLAGFYGGFVLSPVAVGWSIDRTGSYTIAWCVVATAFAAAVVVAARWRREGLRSA